MLKKLLVLSLLLLIAGYASADISIVNPVEKRLLSGERAELGSVQAGETLILSIDSKTGYKDMPSWTQAVFVKGTIPANWKALDSKIAAQTLVLTLQVPKNEKKGAHNIKIKLVEETGRVPSEEAQILIYVEQDLMTNEITELAKDAVVDDKVVFNLVVINDSLAGHDITISSSLPRYWFEPIKLKVNSLSALTQSLPVNAYVYGTKDFEFYITSNLTGERLETFSARINIKPTPKSKFAASLNGLPFFTPNLIPYYLIDAFISFFGQ